MDNYEIRLAYNELENVRLLFEEYKDNLDINLKFQKFEEEVNNLPWEYALPEGRIYVIYYEEKLAGCVALRKIDNHKCEFKRLYVRPEFRGKKLGKILMKKIMTDAKELGYMYGYLDTLTSLENAIVLYQKLGFYEIPSYYENPLHNIKYFKKDLIRT